MARFYSDSKKPADRATIDAEPAPELVALHKEFAIQRDRLEAWGKEWGADSITTEQNHGHEPFEREGVKETVHDVLENVKNVLDERERMSTGANLTGDREKKNIWGPAESVDRRWSSTDRARYGQLAGELRTSIDLLYDISKNRKQLMEGGYPGGGKNKTEPFPPPPSSKPGLGTRNYSESQETLVNPVNNSRSSTQETAAGLQLPPRLDPASLHLQEDRPPPYDSVGATPTTRMIAHLRLPAPPSQLGDNVEFKTVAVLIEYSPFDAGYRSTGVPVPTNRLDAFMNFFGRCGSLHDFPSYGTLQCLGYFEDPREARYGLVYELPKDVSHNDRPTSLLKVLQSASRSMNSSNRQLPPGPPLENRFRLAFNVMQALSKIHGEILHKDVNSSNIVFFHKDPPAARNLSKNTCDIRTPYISSFDLFSEFSIEAPSTAPGQNLYRHPEDPRIFNGICKFCSSRSCKCPKSRFDVYGLGLLLLEIGHWTPLSDLFKVRYTLEDFKKRLETIWVGRLASKCGSIYMKVVQDCLKQSSQNLSDEDLRTLYGKWLRKLQKCCLIDDDHDDMPIDPSTPPARAQSISGTIPRHSPENTLFPTAGDANVFSQQYSYNPFMQLHAAPSPSFFSNNPFTHSLKRLSKQISVAHSIREEHLPADEQPKPTSREPPGSFPRGKAENISLGAVSTTQQRAAQVILRAWRCRNKKSCFHDFKRRITLVQKQWRQRQMRCLTASTSNQGFAANNRIEQEVIQDHAEIQITQIPSKPKLRLHSVKLAAETLDQWHSVMLPRLERIIEKALKNSPETVSIDLIGVGETALSARATIFITCSSTVRVRGLVNRKFLYDTSIFDLRVRRGKIRRSKVTRTKASAPPHRSMMSNQTYDSDSSLPLNPFHQQRPLCGASIGAYLGNKHLPPVSFGGVIRVDDVPYGMTVHHLLDAPSDDDTSDFDEDSTMDYPDRSSARRNDNGNPWLAGIASNPELQRAPTDLMFPLEISDDDEASSEDEEVYSDEEAYVSSDEESDNESVASDNTAGTRGDLKGVIPGHGSEIWVTQPALDDVEDDFFPSEEDKDDDHLDSHKLGYVYASSGIRRWKRKDVKHEIDWALIKLDEHRLQPYNLVQGGRRHLVNSHHLRCRTPKLVEPICRGSVFKPDDDEYPVHVAKTEELGSLHVHCFGRTSGLQTGVISEAMSSVRIYQRSSFSRSWNVIGGFGVGGDSGAWVIDNEQSRICGHVLAWCERNAIAYICPMEVLLEDIGNTLNAQKICLPGCEEEDIILAVERRIGNVARSDGVFIGDNNGARAREMELPDIARLDFGDRERLGLGRVSDRLGSGLVDDRVGSGLVDGRQDSMFFRQSIGSKPPTPTSAASPRRVASRMEYSSRFVGVQSERPMA
ncbi:hypothetical protein E6O75_ATG05254 [Venturia nashicola]|uniref:Protein kinase domain-containing protein n=1 Tax=Venturia nashicola TaxID=86259 RepID=A0A4Z1PCU7_9PEZI|nr:hypothetical protein E6O75_ATG05254 [Venturia nashicola]